MSDPTMRKGIFFIGGGLFDGLEAKRARRSDPETSKAAARAIPCQTPSHLALLAEYRIAGADGLTDEEAATAAQLDPMSCWWKRCSELRKAGLIIETDRTRVGSRGARRLVCVVAP